MKNGLTNTVSGDCLSVFQPVLPIELGGLLPGRRNAGGQVFTCLMVGKFPKYLILIYAGWD